MLPLILLVFTIPSSIATFIQKPAGWKATTWPDNTVYYDLPKALFSAFELSEFQKAFKAIEQNTCIDIKEKSDQKAFVQVGRDSGNSRVEAIGYVGAQAHNLWIKLDDQKNFKYAAYHVIKHEFLHALGLQHHEFQDNNGKGDYNWELAYGNLKKLYNCKGTYPREVTGHAASCLDEDPKCGKSPAKWVCAHAFLKDHCDKTCGKC